MKYRALLEHYQEAAEAISKQFGCANCRGTESLRSCLEAYRVLKQVNVQDVPGWTLFQQNHGGTLDGLTPLLQNTYGAKFSDEFGKTFSQKTLKEGIFHNKQPVNALGSKWYGDLKVLLVSKSGQPPLRKHLPKGVGVAITQASAKAHAVVARCIAPSSWRSRRSRPARADGRAASRARCWTALARSSATTRRRSPRAPIPSST
ncbi:hypothetical protein JGU66_10695 [Myxococcaceae bacterium JPH2]|nr:hypothetical protein [Myxococcaceae bacterium JPH2]